MSKEKAEKSHRDAYQSAMEGDFEKSMKLFKEAISLAESAGEIELMAQSLNCLALVYRREERYEKAIDAYNMVIEQKPDSIDLPDAYNYLGDMMLEEGDDESALRLYLTAMKEYVSRDLLGMCDERKEKVLSLIVAKERFDCLEERPLSDHEQTHLKQLADSGLEMLGITDDRQPHEIVEAVDKWVDDFQDTANEDVDEAEIERLVVNLGTIWGEQVVKEFGWQWVCFEGAGEILAVVSPERALYIIPYEYLLACMQDPELDCTVMLSFNLLKENPPENLRKNDYDHFMMSAFRMVPKPGRTRSLADARMAMALE